MIAGPIGSGAGTGAAAEPDCAQIVPEDVGCGDLSDLVDFRISNLCLSYIRLRLAPPPGTKPKVIWNHEITERVNRLWQIFASNVPGFPCA